MTLDLRTIREVELVKVGHWNPHVSPGADGWTVSEADLASAVEAHRAAVTRKPVLKIGHEDPRFDGGPALGYVDNLRLTDGGRTLVGDLVNVPAAIAKLLPHAYPDRSVEAFIGFTDQDGEVWPMVLSGLALLGGTAPGIDTLRSLQDVGAVYGVPVAAKRVVLRASDSGRTRSRAVAVAAARRRRTHRILDERNG